MTNKDFIMNVNYLLDDTGLINIRKDLDLPLLIKKPIKITSALDNYRFANIDFTTFLEQFYFIEKKIQQVDVNKKSFETQIVWLIYL
jgi:hypothetical protein